MPSTETTVDSKIMPLNAEQFVAALKEGPQSLNRSDVKSFILEALLYDHTEEGDIKYREGTDKLALPRLNVLDNLQHLPEHADYIQKSLTSFGGLFDKLENHQIIKKLMEFGLVDFGLFEMFKGKIKDVVARSLDFRKQIIPDEDDATELDPEKLALVKAEKAKDQRHRLIERLGVAGGAAVGLYTVLSAVAVERHLPKEIKRMHKLWLQAGIPESQAGSYDEEFWNIIHHTGFSPVFIDGLAVLHTERNFRVVSPTVVALDLSILSNNTPNTQWHKVLYPNRYVVGRNI